MAKQDGRQVLYEAIQKQRGKVSLVERLRRTRFLRRRSIKDRLGQNPYDKRSQKHEKPKMETDDWPGEPEKKAKIGYELKKFARKAAVFINSRVFKVSLVAFLTVLMVILVAVRVGTGIGAKNQENPENILGSAENQGTISGSKVPEDAGEKDLTEQALERRIGDHVIVIVQYRTREDLVPVQEFFAKNGIETVIEKRGKYYFLLTKDRFGSPKKPGSEGYVMRERIRSIGENYEAPRGYETFGTKPFHDAYGMKLK